jgi:hypothetical protein
MSSGKESPSLQENTLFWLERCVTAMRAAKARQHAADSMERKHNPPGAASDQPIGVGMPARCWRRLKNPIADICEKVGLKYKAEHRYSDNLGVIYVLFRRTAGLPDDWWD